MCIVLPCVLSHHVYCLTMCIVCHPDVILSDEQLETEFSEDGKKFGIFFAKPRVTISKQKIPNHLQEQKMIQVYNIVHKV